MKHFAISVLMTLSCFLGGQAFAETPSCDGLSNAAKASFETIISSARSYGCCTDTISACLASKPDCNAAKYLFNDACNAAKSGDPDKIKKAIENRTIAMDPSSEPMSIVVTPEHIWGNPDAKTVLTVYLCGRCPYCSKHVPKLLDELEKHDLKDKIAVNLRYFPIKSHDKSTPAALAIEAAAQLGKTWPYLLISYNNFDDFSLNQITVWASQIGLDPQKHADLMKNKELRSFVADSKKEGLKNGVTTTPTFFINGRRVYEDFNTDYLMSLIYESIENNK